MKGHNDTMVNGCEGKRQKGCKDKGVQGCECARALGYKGERP